MSKSTQIAAAAAIGVAVIAFAVYALLPRDDLGATPTVTPSPHPTASVAALTNGPLEAGTYTTDPFSPPNDSLAFTITVPAGWTGFGDIGVLPEQGAAGPDGMGMGFNLVTDLYSDPCSASIPDVEVGPSVDDLVAAFQEQTAYETTTPADVTLSGFSGKRLDLVMPSDVDFASCEAGRFLVWGGSIHAQGPGNVWHLWILDVSGTRVVILAQDNPETSPQDKAELQAIVDSIQIQP
jgi:hypothetical protein